MRSITEGVHTVFHLAALIAIPYSYHAPASYIETNVRGTFNIIQGALDSGVKRVIHTSTSEVYGSAKSIPMDENHPLQAQSPYSASKIGADALAYSYYASFGLPLTIARPFNTFGPRQSARAIIPTIISQLLSGERNIKLGSLDPTRDLNYVLDTCAGFIALAECEKSIGEVVNIGSGQETTMHNLLNLISEIIDVQPLIDIDGQRIRPKNSEVDRLCCDNSKMTSLTGFKPHYSLRSGLISTIDWFRKPENLQRYKAHLYNV